MGISRKLGNLGTALDSGSLSNFLTTNNIEGLFRDVTWTDIANKPTTLDSAAAISYIDSAYIQARQTDIGLESAEITSLVDSAYISARQVTTGIDSAGVLGIVDSAYLEARVSGGLDSATVSNIIDSSYISSKTTVNSGFDFVSIIAEDGQTTFESDGSGNAITYQYGGLLVWYNGILLDWGTDYTALTGTSITLTEAADSDASVVVGKWAIGETYLWGGDRAILAGGIRNLNSNFVSHDVIQSFDMTTSNNATSFGQLSSYRAYLAGTSSRDRGVFVGGQPTIGTQTSTDTIEYITIATAGDATDFGDLTVSRRGVAAAGNGTRGLIFGGQNDNTYPYSDVIDYITIGTTGNATDFGDTVNDQRNTGALADISRAVTSGYISGTGGGGTYNYMDYVTISVLGNATSFGEMTTGRQSSGGASDETRGIFGGGTRAGGPLSNIMDYITIQTTGNATDFGDLAIEKSWVSAASNGTYATFSGGYDGDQYPQSEIDKITIQTLGNSSHPQDLAQSTYTAGSAAGDPS